MRKVGAYIVALIYALLLGIVWPQAAGATTYTLDELGMSIDIPDELIVFTRDTPANDPNYAAYGFTKESMDDLMENQNSYLDALEPTVAYEILIIMVESPLEDFNLLSDTTVSFLASGMVDAAEEFGLTYSSYEVYQHEQVKFLKLYASRPLNDQTVHSLQYYTVCNCQAISITLHSYSGPVSEEQEVLLKEIVDSADFQNAASSTVPAPSTDPFRYTDPKTHLSFTVPANWLEEPLSKERETLDVKFASLQEPGLIMMYGSSDLLSTWSEDVDRELFRSDEANYFLAESAVEGLTESLDADSIKISRVTYTGREYVMVEGNATTQADQLSLSLPMTYLLRVENGYLFLFQFSGEPSSPFFSDFEALIDSVQYPTLLDGPFESTQTAPSLGSEGSDSSAAGAALLVTVLLVGIIAGVFFLLRKRSSHTLGGNASVEISSPSASFYTAEVPQNSQQADDGPPSPPPLFCQVCGASLPADSLFCHICGAKLTDKGGEEA